MHPEGLPDIGEVQIVIELGGDPDVSDFKAAMLGAIHGGVIGLAVELVKMSEAAHTGLLSLTLHLICDRGQYWVIRSLC